jgi:hypothetical protein
VRLRCGTVGAINLLAPRNAAFPASMVQLRFSFIDAVGLPLHLNTELTFYDFDQTGGGVRECMQLGFDEDDNATAGLSPPISVAFSEQSELETYEAVEAVDAYLARLYQQHQLAVWPSPVVCSTTRGIGADKYRRYEHMNRRPARRAFADGHCVVVRSSFFASATTAPSIHLS